MRIPRRTGLPAIALALLVLVASGGVFAAGRQPHLLVVIVADQFRADYLDAYRAGFSAPGFNRLLREGAVFERLRFDHLTTLTAPDAAVLATGAYPELNGIVGDRWYNPATKRVVSADEAWSIPYPSVVPSNAGPSAGNLIGSSVADELRLATAGESKVVVVAGSSVAATMLGGRRPNGSFWLRPDGQFETSKHYAERLPAWAQEFNQAHPIMRFDGKPWIAVDAPDQNAPLRVIELAATGGRENFLALYQASPFAIEDIFEFAKRAVEEEALGSRQYSDLLIVHVSALGRLALETGATSPLMRDMVLRLDRQIGDLLGWLDGRIGLDKVSLVFTAAHGSPPLPEEAAQQGLAAGRIAGQDIVEAINTALAREFAMPPFVEKYIYPFVYLNSAARELPKDRYDYAVEVAGQAAQRIDGVAAYYTLGGASAPLALRDRLRRSWYAGRSGDLMIVYEPYFVESFGDSRGTASGSPYRYDTDVPLILFGAGFRTGRFAAEVDAASLAPTLAALLGVPAPSSAVGKVLAEALQPALPPAPAVGPPTPTR